MPSTQELVGRKQEDYAPDRATIERPDPEVRLLEDLLRESEQRRSRAGPGEMSIAMIAERNGARFLGDHSNRFHGTNNSLSNEEGYKHPVASSSQETGVVKGVINRTSTSIMATTAAMTDSPVDIKFMPVESADPWQYLLKGKAARKLALFLEGSGVLEGYTTEQLNGEEFIDDARAEWLMENILDPKTGMPLITEDSFHIKNDATKAKAAQILFDNRWKQGNGDYHFTEHALYTGIFGFQAIRFQWDRWDHAFEFENVHSLAVWPDPVHTTIYAWDFHIFDVYIPLSKALKVKEYQDFEPELRLAAQNGKLVQPTGQMYPSTYRDQEYTRPMVQVRTGWIKNQLVDRTPEEAEREGLGDDPAQWPKTRGILQIQVLPQIGRTIGSQRCKYIVEPMGWSVNMPVMFSPWGLGEPFRLEDIQLAINRELTTIINWGRFYAYPAQLMPASVHEALTRQGHKAHIRPGVCQSVPDNLWMKLTAAARGNPNFTIPAPPIPRDRVNVLVILLQEHDRLSGHVEALQGRTQSSQTSGVLFDQMRQEARGPLALKAKFLTSTVERLALLGIDSIVKWMPRWMRLEILDQYPPVFVDALVADMSPAKMDIAVEVSMSKGSAQRFKRAESRELFAVEAIDKRTLLEDHDRDPDSILRRQRDDLQEAVAQQQEVQAALPEQSEGATTIKQGGG